MAPLERIYTLLGVADSSAADLDFFAMFNFNILTDVSAHTIFHSTKSLMTTITGCTVLRAVVFLFLLGYTFLDIFQSPYALGNYNAFLLNLQIFTDIFY